jgi:hypothetical protein
MSLLSEYKQYLQISSNETLETISVYKSRHDVFTTLHYELFSLLLKKYSDLLPLNEANKNINSYLQNVEWYTNNRYNMTMADINESFTLNKFHHFMLVEFI